MLRYHARWVLPVSRAPIENGTVAVRDGRIEYVGPRSEAPRGNDRDLGDAILLPGLVNAHTHLELTAMRGFLENLPFNEWIITLQAAKRSVMSAETMLDSALFGITEGVRAGITTYADTCDSGVVLRAFREAGVRGIMYQEVFGPSPDHAEAMLREVREKIAVLSLGTSRLHGIGISPHAPYTVSDALFSLVAAYAGDSNLPMAIHIAESEAEHQLIVSAAGPFAEALRARGIVVKPRARSPVELLRKLGVLAKRPLLIHCVRIDADDIGAISAAGCGVAHCPISNAKLGHGTAPVVELLRAGIQVGLGSDSMASNNRMHLLEEARFAALEQRGRTGRYDAFTARQALEMATLGGAKVLALDDRIGSLEKGKDADLAAFPLDAHSGIDSGDPCAAAIFALGGTCARFVSVAGQPLLEDGRLVTEDADLPARVRGTGERLRVWQSGRSALS